MTGAEKKLSLKIVRIILVEVLRSISMSQLDMTIGAEIAGKADAISISVRIAFWILFLIISKIPNLA